MQNKIKINPKDQPTLEEKKETLHGKQTGWDFVFTSPGVPTAFWSDDGWIAYIGDNWFRQEVKQTPNSPGVLPSGPVKAKTSTPYPFCRTPERCIKAHRCMAEICCND